ncbi:MAG: selenium metabolism-associated LysR family transcriptional regulator [Oscillospiraceae bacterium]|nr:selenium metabolism-associated LysR family transcriptional regulator [Oscillospiraceae bacterium]
MDFRQIEAFVAVAQTAGFSAAAEHLHISQPSVSAYVATLERELGHSLINRSTKTLTLAGERFFESAQRMLALRQGAIEALRGLNGEVRGKVSVLASSVPALYILPALLAGFHRIYPDVTFDVRAADTAEVVIGVAAHKADIGFAGSAVQESKCDFVPFVDERLVLIAPRDSVLCADKLYSLDEVLHKQGFIGRERGSGTRAEYEKFFAQQNISTDKIRTVVSVDSTQAIINAVRCGLGVAIVSQLAAAESLERGEVKSIQLQCELSARKIYIVTNRTVTHSHLTRLLLEHIQGG